MNLRRKTRIAAENFLNAIRSCPMRTLYPATLTALIAGSVACRVDSPAQEQADHEEFASLDATSGSSEWTLVSGKQQGIHISRNKTSDQFVGVVPAGELSRIEILFDKSLDSVINRSRSRNCAIALNGGYFDSTGQSLSTIIQNSRLSAPGSSKISRSEGVLYPKRSLFAIQQGKPVIAWAAVRRGAMFRYDSPSPATKSESSGGSSWQPELAIGAGPRLVVKGTANVTAEQEVFDKENIGPLAKRSRSAIGIRGDGAVLLVAVRSATLKELAATMLRLKAVEAMNLDGGGSTAMADERRAQFTGMNDGVSSGRDVASVICVHGD